MANVFTTRMDVLVARWRLEAAESQRASAKERGIALRERAYVRERFRIPSKDDLDPVLYGDLSFAGLVVVYDTIRREIVWRSDFSPTVVTPAGLCFGEDALYVADLEGASIAHVPLRGPSAGRPVRRTTHPYFNDLHAVTRTRRGFLVASSGLDLVIEVDPEGRSLFEWWAADHGFHTAPNGTSRIPERGVEHRHLAYPTPAQTTHVNQAMFLDDAEQMLAVVLFHQGAVVGVARDEGDRVLATRTLVSGLSHPHGLVRTRDGYVICSSSSSEIVCLDSAFQEVRRHSLGAGWLQHAVPVDDDTLLVNAVDEHTLLEVGLASGKVLGRTPYDPAWRMGELRVVPDEIARRSSLFGAAVDPAERVGIVDLDAAPAHRKDSVSRPERELPVHAFA